jgi:hypothetical protein
MSITSMTSDVRVCSVPGCDRRTVAQGLCNAHHKRKMRHGDPLGGRTAFGTAARYIQEVVLPFTGQECLTWPFTRNGNGYPSTRHNGRQMGAHRAVCEMAHGPAPTPKHEAAHTCGKGHEGCVNPNHLQWKTSKVNIADKLVHGTIVRGTRHYRARLSNEQVKEIRALRGVVPGKELARRFGVAASTVCCIQKRTIWAWL